MSVLNMALALVWRCVALRVYDKYSSVRELLKIPHTVAHLTQLYESAEFLKRSCLLILKIKIYIRCD